MSKSVRRLPSTRATVLSASIAIATAGAVLPAKNADAWGFSFNPADWASGMFNLMESMFNSMFDMAEDMFVGTLTLMGESVDVMIDFGKFASGMMIISPYDIAKDGFAKMMEISMRVSREIMRQDPGFLEVAMAFGFKGYEMMANAFPGDLEDQLMAEMFKTMMVNDEVTKQFLLMAKDNEALAKVGLPLEYSGHTFGRRVIATGGVHEQEVCEALVSKAQAGGSLAAASRRESGRTEP